MKASSMKSVTRLGLKGKSNPRYIGPYEILNPRYIGPYEILKRIGKVAYLIALPSKMENFHDVFHVSMLRKCRLDSESIIMVKQEEVTEEMSIDMIPVQIMQLEERKLRYRSVPMVLVL